MVAKEQIYVCHGQHKSRMAGKTDVAPPHKSRTRQAFSAKTWSSCIDRVGWASIC
jgi:hypothetical protein